MSIKIDIFLGLISSETRNCINEKMLNFYDEISNDDDNSSVKEILAQAENNNHALLYLRKQSVPDKAIVNVVKALSGVYLAVIFSLNLFI